ncbi:hypothetical protein [Streptomyces sp. NPDC047000]|uniref:hypothetical protein n=1 Tax=Streptomyces sp. NPDC047000 TaxID=3155474 RepID=UPI0033F99EE8
MADEQYRWLDGETAELLLRGDSVKAVGSVDPSARDQAERLAGTLGALSVPSTATEGELPGEAAAVAAFRKAAEARTAEPAPGPSTGRDPSGDVGLVRIGRPERSAGRRARFRPSRPVRLGLAAALLFGSAGGAAALAATGVIPGPFDDSEPGPAVTVPAAVTPDRAEGSTTPDGAATGGPGTSPTGAGATGGPGGGTGRKGSSAGPVPGVTGPSGAGVSGRQGVTAACRDLRDGKNLGAGRTRKLEEAAGGADRVPAYCQDVLRSAGESTGSPNGQDTGNATGNGGGQGNGNAGGNGNGGGQGEQGDQNGGGDDNGPIREGHGVRRQDVTAVTPSPASFAPPASPSAQAPSAPGAPGTGVPSPEPTYSAL